MVSIPDYVGLGIGNHQLDANAALQRDDSIPVPMDDRDLGPGCPQIHQVPVHQPHPSAYHVVHRMPGRVVGVPCQVYDRKVEIPGEGKQRCRRWFNNRGSSNVLSSESILIISKKKNRYLVSGIIPVNSFQFSIIKPFYLITARKTSKKKNTWRILQETWVQEYWRIKSWNPAGRFFRFSFSPWLQKGKRQDELYYAWYDLFPGQQPSVTAVKVKRIIQKFSGLQSQTCFNWYPTTALRFLK